MQSIKRIELVIEAIERQNVIAILEKINIRSYTLYNNVGGSGDRGERQEVVFGEKFENMTFVIACPEASLSTVIEAIRPLLKSFGGMCLVSDAQWVIH